MLADGDLLVSAHTVERCNGVYFAIDELSKFAMDQELFLKLATRNILSFGKQYMVIDTLSAGPRLILPDGLVSAS